MVVTLEKIPCLKMSEKIYHQNSSLKWSCPYLDIREKRFGQNLPVHCHHPIGHGKIATAMFASSLCLNKTRPLIAPQLLRCPEQCPFLFPYQRTLRYPALTSSHNSPQANCVC